METLFILALKDKPIGGKWAFLQGGRPSLLTARSTVHVAAAGSAAFFSGEQCCTSSLLCDGPVSFQLLVVLMVKIAGSIMI
ncbi:hypothetical protein H5410_059187 [Solanum commersonii]|uniref:Uncharacterized protein n=1 Tax=Solanum commersonii TaxID=4109 RepID=A0A9J5W1Q8_SOLCO|nr:hypothetical protein H5410_059187 [Solanum commersonii]